MLYFDFVELTLLMCIAVLMEAMANADAVTVTLTTDNGFGNPQLITRMQNNLGSMLTEINAAYNAKRDVTTSGLNMTDRAKDMLVTLWDVTRFYCDDEEVVDRCWQLKDGYMVRQIPMILDTEDPIVASGTYQEVVVEFDRSGNISDFRFALDAQLSESLERCGSVVSVERRAIILEYLDKFRTAYCTKDIDFLEKVFSDDAVIITGKVIRTRPNDMNTSSAKVVYNRQNKQEYLRNLQRAFARNKYIDVQFSNIGGEKDGRFTGDNKKGGCSGITQSLNNPNFYGVRLFQEWKSSSYSDEGYVFLLWNFTKEDEPVIEVRTWQPSYVDSDKKQRLPEEDIFDISSVEDMIN